MIKMYCIFNPEVMHLMGDNRGKIAAQAGHAYLHAWWDAIKPGRYDYIDKVCFPYFHNYDARKIGLIGESLDQLYELEKYYKPICGVSLVEDCGYTIFTEPTITCLGIGPLDDEDKCEVLKSMRLFI